MNCRYNSLFKNVAFIFRIFISFTFCSFCVEGNDGEFYGGGGSSLFPIFNDNVSVRKEVLKISYTKNLTNNKYVSDNLPLHVEIDYEFYNHGDEQELLIGFESMLAPTEGGNEVPPDIKDFRVMVNGMNVTYESRIIHDPYAIYNSEKSNKNDSIFSKDSNENEDENPNRYIYYFKAVFKQGINRINHSYDCNYVSSTNGSYANDLSYSYDLMPAMRWKNRQIDDFTLILDFGDLSHFQVYPLMDSDKDRWKFTGGGKINVEVDSNYSTDEDTNDRTTYLSLFCQQGRVEYKCKNFKPTNDLILFFRTPTPMRFDMLSFSPEDDGYDESSLSEYFKSFNIDNKTARRIYRNLPFARRGYIFKDKLLTDFYKKHTSWYEPNAKYNGNIKNFTTKEKEIINGAIPFLKHD